MAIGVNLHTDDGYDADSSFVANHLRENSAPPKKAAPKKETAMTQPATPPKGPTAEVVIAAYIKTRDEIEAKEKAVKAEVAELKAIQEKRAMWLMGTMDKIGATSMKGTSGTAFIDWKDSATVSDAPAFLDWVHSDWEKNKTFLENRVSKTAVKQRLEDGQTPPPGVSYTKVKDIKIRRS